MTVVPLLLTVCVLAAGWAAKAAWSAGRREGTKRRLSASPQARSQGTKGEARPRRVLPARPPARVTAALAEADIGMAPPVAWSAWLGGMAVASAVALAAGGPGLAIVTGLASAVAPPVWARARAGRAGARLEQGLPAALEAVARSLRTGASLRQAVSEAAGATPGRLGAELGRAAGEAGLGNSLVAALEALAQRRPTPGVRLAVAALCLGAETGGAQARAVDGVAATLRERLGVGAELRALSSQARISALVIGLAPLGFGVFAAATDPRTSAFLLHTGPGLAILTVGLTLDGLGWLWMQRLAGSAVA